MYQLPHTLVEPYEYISEKDGAVDHSDPDFENKWRVYLDGKGDPPLRGEPTRFKLRHLPTPAVRLLSPALTKASEEKEHFVAACYLAGTMALVGVDNLDGADGKKVSLSFEKREGVSMLSQVSQETLGFHLLVELGQIAIARRFANPL